MVGIRNVQVGLMALDRPDDDFGSPERERPAGDVPAARSEPVESRSRAEYYEVLRAADADRSTIELAASLAAHHTPVTAEERDELRGLLEAMGMPTDPIKQLNVQG
jgi:hypothetical protein